MHQALLICNSYYPLDPARLPELLGPRSDGLLMWATLTDSETGLFHPSAVAVLSERRRQDILVSCESFFTRARKNDDLLLYFSGHAVMQHDELFWCAADTEATKPISTAVSAGQVSQLISATSARSITIILDCCFSGAFKGPAPLNLGGTGRYVISATTQSERALDATEEGAASPFTRVLLSSIAQEATSDNAGFVDVDGVYRAIVASSDLKDLATVERDFDGSGSPHVAKRRIPESRPDGAAEPVDANDEDEQTARPITLPMWRGRRSGDYSQADVRSWIPLVALGISIIAAALLSYSGVDQFYSGPENYDIERWTKLTVVAAGITGILSVIVGVLDFSWQRSLEKNTSRRLKIQVMSGWRAQAARRLRIVLALAAACILLVPLTGLGVVSNAWVAGSGLLALVLVEAVGAIWRRGDQLALAATVIMSGSQFIPIYIRGRFETPGFHNGLDSWTGWVMLLIGALGVIWWASTGGPAGYWIATILTGLVIFASLPRALETPSPHLLLSALGFLALGLAISIGAGRLIPLEGDARS